MRKLLGIACLLSSASVATAEDVSTILARMNEAASAFHTASADLTMITYTAIIDDKTVENGTLKMQREKSGETRAVIDFSGQKDAAREIGLFGKTVRIYYPNGPYYQDYDLGKNSDVLNQFLLLGFGSSGDELSRNYTISQDGTEKLSDVNTTKLLLVPKDSKALQYLAKIELWIPDGQSNPLQQQFYKPSGNYQKVTYTHLQLNPPIKGTLEIKMQKGTPKRSS